MADTGTVTAKARRSARAGPAPWPEPLLAYARSRGHDDPVAAVRADAAAALAAAGQNAPPVGLSPVWTALGARRVTVGSGPPARLRADASGFILEVRSGGNWRRQRFTVAHELGHLLLFRAAQGDSRQAAALVDPENWEAVERLCDAAAAELLLPHDAFLADLARAPLDGERLRALYDAYLVSWPALLRRVADVKRPTAVTLWSRHARNPQERAAPRLVAAYGHPAGVYLPDGLTSSRHVRPDLVTHAYASGAARSEWAEIVVREDVAVSGPGLALHRAPAPRREPSFDGMPVPDETSASFDVVLLVGRAAH